MNGSTFRRLVGAALLLGAGSSAQAQQLEEVVVTAQHRQESLQSIPVTVSALTADTLAKADIFDPATVAANVPGMAYAEFSPGQALVSMRGISSIDDGAGLDNSVSLFLDGVYIGRLASINFDMFDLERLEVLRGPQGTLFGRNSIGGAINVVSSKPSDTPTAKVGVTVGNEGIFRTQAYLSGPLSDQLSAKIVVNHRQHDGFVDNVILNKKQQDEDQTSFRGQVRYTAESSDWLLSGDYMEDDREDMGRTPLADNAPLIAIQAANGGGGRNVTAPADGFSKRSASGVSLRGEIERENGIFTTITAVRNAETDWEMASAGAPLGGLGLPFDEVIDDIIEDISTFSQEFRWTSTQSGPFNYTGGAYFLKEDTDRVEQFKITAAGVQDPNTVFRLADPGDQAVIGNEYAATFNETTSWALYGQGTYDFNDAVTLTFGGRYTVDDKKYRANSVNCGADRTGTAFEGFPACAGVGGSLAIIAESFDLRTSEDWDDFSAKVALQWQASDNAMLFASASQGYKSGGFGGSQGIAAAAITPVEPETAINYEVGYKGDLANDTLRVNITGFFTDYEDLQVVRFGPVPGSDFGTFVTTNIGTAEISGLETELTWFPTENLKLTGNLALLDTDVQGLILNDIDVSGSDLRQAPDTSYNIAAEYNWPMQDGELDLRVSLSHTDEQITDYLDQRTIVQEQDLLDARIGWVSGDERWEVALWGKNLTDELYIAHSYVIGPGVIGVFGPPRTVGLTVNWSMQ